jgi:urease accessory protein
MLQITEIIGNIHRDESLANAHDEYEEQDQVERLILDEHDRKRSRLRTTTDRGTDVGLVIDHPAGLSAGDVIVYNAERMIIITAEQQEVAVLDIDIIENRERAVTLGHHLGNQHWTLTIRNGRLYIPVPEKRAHAERVIEGTLGDVPIEYEQADPAIFEENAQPNHHSHEHITSDQDHRHRNEPGHSHDHYDQ